MNRAQLEARVDELAAEHSGAAFAEAVRELSDTLDDEEREELKAILLVKARVLEDAVSERFESKGWIRRTLGRIGDAERKAREEAERRR